jgi:hypothetical protein
MTSRLARALMPFSESLLEFVDVTERRKGEAERRRGQEFARENAKQAAAMVRKGLLPAHESPWYLYGVREQVGRIASQQYDSYVRIQMAQSPVTNGYDAQAFEAFLARTRDEFLDQQIGVNRDPAAMIGFSPRADQIDANYRSEFGATASKNIEVEALEQTVVETRGFIQEIVERDGTVKELGRNLSDLLTKQIEVGVDKRAANDAVLAGVAEMVLATGDTELFDVLQHIPTSKGNTLANHPMAVQVIRDTKDRLIQRERADARYGVWADEQARKIVRRQELGNLIVALTGPDARSVDIDAVARRIAPHDPDLAARLPSVAANLINHEGFDNPDLVDELIVEISRNPDIDEGDLIDWFDADAYSRQDLLFLRGELEKQRQLAGGTGSEGMREMALARTRLGRTYASDFDSPLSAPEAVHRRGQAEALLTRNYRRAATEELADRTINEHIEWLSNESERIRMQIPPGGEFGFQGPVGDPFARSWEDALTPVEYSEILDEIRRTGTLSVELLDDLHLKSGQTTAEGLITWLGLPGLELQTEPEGDSQ